VRGRTTGREGRIKRVRESVRLSEGGREKERKERKGGREGGEGEVVCVPPHARESEREAKTQARNREGVGGTKSERANKSERARTNW